MVVVVVLPNGVRILVVGRGVTENDKAASGSIPQTRRGAAERMMNGQITHYRVVGVRVVDPVGVNRGYDERFVYL